MKGKKSKNPKKEKKKSRLPHPMANLLKEEAKKKKKKSH